MPMILLFRIQHILDPKYHNPAQRKIIDDILEIGQPNIFVGGADFGKIVENLFPKLKHS